MPKEIKVVEVKSELGAGTHGASLGVDAIKIASVNAGSDLFTRFEGVTVHTDNSPLYRESKYTTAKRIKDIFIVEKETCNVISDTAKTHFPIILGGDHSTGAGVIMGIKQAFPNLRIGIVWIDAHADLHTPYTTPSGNMHGMPLAMCLAEDNLEEQINTPDDEVLEIWNDIKNIGGNEPKIIHKDMVFIALRDTERPEEALIAKHGMKVFSVGDVTEKTPEAIVVETMDYLSECDLVCVSFDVDSLDTEISVGTGTPVPNGLSVEQARRLNMSLIKNAKVASWEMVEVNPTLDTRNAMANAAFEVLEGVIEAHSEI